MSRYSDRDAIRFSDFKEDNEANGPHLVDMAGVMKSGKSGLDLSVRYSPNDLMT